jgi:hypothetical protein
MYSLICKIYTLICKTHTLICKIHTLICKFYTLICKIYTLICKLQPIISRKSFSKTGPRLPFYRLKCKFYRLKCKIYRLKCEFYRLKCKFYRLKCKFYRLKCKIYRLKCATRVNLSFWLTNFQNLTYLKLGSNALKLYRIVNNNGFSKLSTFRAAQKAPVAYAYDTEMDDLLKVVSHNNWDVNKRLLGAWIANLDVYEYNNFL